MEKLAHNYHALRQLTPYGTKFMGLVKADAYGHGAVPVAKKLEELGADYLGVACLDEAIELREAGNPSADPDPGMYPFLLWERTHAV